MGNNSISMRLLRLRPVFAFLLVNTGFAISMVVRGSGASDASGFTASFIAAVVLIGWPAIIVEGLSTIRPDVGHPARVWLAFLCTLVVQAVLIPLLMNATGDYWYWNVIAAVTWLLGFFAPLYVIWSASNLLITLEEHHPASVNQSIGTFLMLFFLPVGVFFLQKRVRRLLPDRQA